MDRPAHGLLVAGLLLALAVQPVGAQVNRSGGEANALLMQQFQQISSERTQLQAENAKLKADLATAQTQLDGAHKEIDSLKAGTHRDSQLLEASRSKSQGDEKALADTRAKLDELIGRFRELASTLRDAESDRTLLKQKVASAASAFDLCAERNDALFRVTSEVLDRWEHQGGFSCLVREEPFTRLKRIQIENLTDDYRQRAAELRVNKAAAAAGAPPPPSGSSPARSDTGAIPPRS